MKILVTGATGFIGKHVVAELLRLGHRVVASSSGKRGLDIGGGASVEYRPLDMGRLNEREDYFEYFGKPEAAIHLAWEGLPNYRSLFHYEDNLPRHYRFLKNLVLSGCRDITVTGTCFEYGMREGVLREDMCTAPANPYGLAKDTLNKFMAEFRKKEKFMLKWARLFYLYGKGQSEGSLVPQLEKALDAGEKVFNMSGGEQVRDYLPVQRAAEYIVKIACQDRVTGNINCCSGVPVTVREVVENIMREKGRVIALNLGYYDYPDYEPMTFWGDNSKLQSIIENNR